jgi:hypothetical protein
MNYWKGKSVLQLIQSMLKNYNELIFGNFHICLA